MLPKRHFSKPLVADKRRKPIVKGLGWEHYHCACHLGPSLLGFLFFFLSLRSIITTAASAKGED